MGALTKDRLIYSAADAAESDQVGVHLLAGTDGEAIDSTSNALHVLLQNASVAVTATDLDIRDLTHVSDSVKVGDGTDFLAVNGDGSINAVVTATDLDIRDLSHTQDSVKIGDGTDFLLVSAAGEGNVVLSATSGIFAEDSAHVSADKGQFILGVRNDASAALTSADGDYSPLAVDSAGRLKVVASFTSNFEYAEDAAHSSGAVGAFVLAVANHTQGALHSADGDYASLQVDSAGRLRVISDIDLVGDLVGDDEVDSEDPLKVGSRAVNQASALSAISAAGDKANVISDLYRRVFINSSPNVSVLVGTVTVGATAVALPASALAGRTKMTIQNTSNNDIYIGDSGVTTSTGIRISKGSTYDLEVGQAIAMFAIAAGAGNVVRVMELA